MDRRALWRLGSWAVGSIGALVLAILVSQSSIQGRQDQLVAADLARQSQQIQRLTKEAQAEVTRLGSAIETLNGDRDRLFSRVTVIEQNLEFGHRLDRPAGVRVQAGSAAASDRDQRTRRGATAATIGQAGSATGHAAGRDRREIQKDQPRGIAPQPGGVGGACRRGSVGRGTGPNARPRGSGISTGRSGTGQGHGRGAAGQAAGGAVAGTSKTAGGVDLEIDAGAARSRRRQAA